MRLLGSAPAVKQVQVQAGHSIRQCTTGWGVRSDLTPGSQLLPPWPPLGNALSLPHSIPPPTFPVPRNGPTLSRCSQHGVNVPVGAVAVEGLLPATEWFLHRHKCAFWRVRDSSGLIQVACVGPRGWLNGVVNLWNSKKLFIVNWNFQEENQSENLVHNQLIV